MIDNILLFIEQHSEWASIIVFLIALIESLVLVGLFLPGWVLLVGIGGLIGVDVLGFYSIVAAAYLGAVIGESLSFYLGFHYHQKILGWPVIAKHKKLIDYSHSFFRKHGVSGVFIARFFGPTRSFVPFIAGVCEMPKNTFLWVNAISGLLWAPLYLIPGILLGAAFTLGEEQSYYLLFTLFMIGVGVTIGYKSSKSVFKSGKNIKLSLVKAVLSWAIVICMLVIFVRSPMWALLSDILSVVWSKL